MAKLEVACFNEEAALLAASEGVDRIELCENYELGGITPQTDTLLKLKKESNVPVYVMIRPRGGDFNYNEKEFEMMKSHLLQLKEVGADGFVFGILTEDQKVDLSKNEILINLAGELPCTFHRAFDRIADKEEALEQIIKLGFKTILTSGGQHPVMEGISQLKLIEEQANGRITILVGGGVRSSNAAILAEDFDFLHSACIKPGTEEIDLDELRTLKAILKEK